MDNYVDIKQAIEITGKSESTVRKIVSDLAEEGKARKIKNKWFVEREALTGEETGFESQPNLAEIEIYKSQLEIKDEQLRVKDDQIRELFERLHEQNAIIMNQQRLLTTTEGEDPKPIIGYFVIIVIAALAVIIVLVIAYGSSLP